MKRSRLLPWVVVLACAASAASQTFSFELEPHQSHVAFTLDATFHTVHGSFALRSGHLRLDTSTGEATGLLVLDATSGESGNSGRDHKMHKDILESAKYPEITFAPHRISGQVPKDGKSQITVDGTMTLQGQPHEMSIPVPVEVHAGQAVADLSFVVPYVQWGLKNPSTFILRVSDKVAIDVHAVGRIEAAGR